MYRTNKDPGRWQQEVWEVTARGFGRWQQEVLGGDSKRLKLDAAGGGGKSGAAAAAAGTSRKGDGKVRTKPSVKGSKWVALVGNRRKSFLSLSLRQIWKNKYQSLLKKNYESVRTRIANGLHRQNPRISLVSLLELGISYRYKKN
jgi:hypothetical protein